MKNNKKISYVILILTSVSFACDCSSSVSSAYKGAESQISPKMDAFKEKLKKLNIEIEKANEFKKKEFVFLNKSIKNEEKILTALQKEIQAHEKSNSFSNILFDLNNLLVKLNIDVVNKLTYEQMTSEISDENSKQIEQTLIEN